MPAAVVYLVNVSAFGSTVHFCAVFVLLLVCRRGCCLKMGGILRRVLDTGMKESIGVPLKDCVGTLFGNCPYPEPVPKA